MHHKSTFVKGQDFIGVVCVFYCHDNKGNLLLHKRSSLCRDEQGRWDPGGGSLEFGEELDDCVKREVKEEYCADVKKIKLLGVENNIRFNNKSKSHWIAFIYSVLVDPKQVKIGEPDHMDDIGWFTENNLPKPLHSKFLPFYNKYKDLI